MSAYITITKDKNDDTVYPVTKVSALYNADNTEVGGVSGILKGNGAGQLTAATAGTDYQAPLPSVTNDRYLHTNASTGALEWGTVDLTSRAKIVTSETEPSTKADGDFWFDLVGTFSITPTLTNVTGSASNPTTVKEGGGATLTFTAGTGYKLPDSVTVTGATGTWTKATGTLVLSNATGNVSFTIEGVQLAVYDIACNLTGVTGAAGNPTTIQEIAGTATLTFSADSGYLLPDSVTVTGATGVWTKATGTLVLSNATGNVGVTIVRDIPQWATATDEQIASFVAKDRSGEINLRDYWNVGDTRTVTLSAMEATGVAESHAAQTVELVLMDNTCTGFTWAEAPTSGATVPRFIVGMKNCLNESGTMNNSNTNSGGWMNCARRTWCNSVFKNAVPSTLVSIFKQFSWKQGIGGNASSGLNTTTDTFGLTPAKCVSGSQSYSYSDEASQYSQWAWYQTESNKVKTRNGSSATWWGCSPLSGDVNAMTFCTTTAEGVANRDTALTDRYFSVFGCI